MLATVEISLCDFLEVPAVMRPQRKNYLYIMSAVLEPGGDRRSRVTGPMSLKIFIRWDQNSIPF